MSMSDSHVATACIILARGGSKGVPLKNLRPVGGVSLIGRSVRAGMAAARVDAVYVSTDDPAISQEAARFGAQIIDRPADLSGDTATSEAGWLHAIAQIAERSPELSQLVFLQCTSPFTTGADIDGCLDAMRAQGADCALSVVEDHGFLWGFDGTGAGVGLNHDATQQRQRRQDMAPQFKESGAIYCASRTAFENVGRRFCGTVALYPVDHPPIEIDTLADLDLCSVLARTADGAEVDLARLAQIKAIVMDFDGVHTDNLVFTDQHGIETVRTSRGDGMGLAALRDTGRWEMMILSKERNPVVEQRARKLKLPVEQAVDDKVAALDTWLAARGLGWAQLLYVGNDINDLGPMEKAGLAVCPQDAHMSVLPIADWILPEPGGKGALRALADVMLQTQPPA